MVIKFSEAEKISISKGEIWDYPMPDKNLGISYQKLEGRGPQKGKYLNKVCHEVYFIINGSASFSVGENSQEVSKNDVVIVEPNTPHFIETSNLEYITITRPDWYEEQYEEVE